MNRNEYSSSNNNISDNNMDIDLSRRSYQVEIMKQAKSENLIVCLPTGSGKTFIAIMLIKELLPISRKSFQDGGKRSILLTKTVELARQHYTTMKVHIKETEIGLHVGSSTIGLEDTERWRKEFEQCSVLIFTAQKFLSLLSHNIFSMNKINLLIFDECQHATGNDHYPKIMKNHYTRGKDSPRILGLTASISAQKIEMNKLPIVARELEKIFEARIETGSDQSEIIRYSTSVSVKSQRCDNYKAKVCLKEKAVMNIFKTIESLRDQLDTKKNDNDTTNSLSSQSQKQSLKQLQCRLDNILSVGDDLGLYGLFLAMKALRAHFSFANTLMKITKSTEDDLHKKIIEKLDSLIEDFPNDLFNNQKIKFSDKVLQAKQYIQQNQASQTIVFVERIYTAKFLCQVLKEIFGKSMKIEYLSGSKIDLNENISSRNSREIAEAFRNNRIQVLVSTAVVEEGLDVSACNLVIRFNKPENFSSYMQSKGRARAKDEKALFILFRDESDCDSYMKNSEEYENYEYMEKMLRQSFKVDFSDDTSSNDDLESLPLYRPTHGIKIDGIRAIQIIYQYCAGLKEGETLLPEFCFRTNSSGIFQCTLSMPSNCPVKDDIICENRNKKLAKQECCLKMVEELYKANEFDKDTCLPKRKQLFDQSEEALYNMNEIEISLEALDKQIVHFPPKLDRLSTQWYLYRVHLPDNNDLGFVVPCQLFQLPHFKLYGTDCEFLVEIIYLKTIDFQQYKDQLNVFCSYIFDEVFEHMNAKSKANLKFDIEHSTFQLLPCLLTESGDIDQDRMISTCSRKNQLIQNPLELSDDEVYISLNTSEKQFFINISDPILSKRASDRMEFKKNPSSDNREYKRKLPENIETYADYFEYKRSDIHIERDFTMATVQSFKKPRTNYLRGISLETTREKNSSSIVSEVQYEYIPVEILRYAPLSQKNFELIYKLPTILIRTCQLTYIEELRQLFTEKLSSHLFINNNQISPVTFHDCLSDILSPNHSTVLPLISFNYNDILSTNEQFQLSPDLLFQAITRRSAGEQTDMENLEILGDCFLKFSICMSLYHQHPNENSGKLTRRKDWLVSNKCLHQLATNKKLKSYISAQVVQYSGKEQNWIPPGYIVTGEHADRYLKQKTKPKSFPDMIESLIGAFLISTNYTTTIKFMDWLGLPTIPKNEQKVIVTTPSILYSENFENNDEIIKEINEFYIDQKLNDIEQNIGYTFKNKAYLIAAFTHPSYSNNNRLTQCYDRLEYLGDAVLDFLLIRSIFIDYYKYVTPSQVTSVRHDLSNNGRLAYFLVYLKLHQNILHRSNEFFSRMTHYVNDETIFPPNNSSKFNNINQWADSTAPKVLADVFEALIGAMFIDSGYSLPTVWKFVHFLLGDYIKRSVQDPNLNPIRSFYEQKGEIIQESKDEEGYTICCARLATGEEFLGRGKNRKLAKFDACRKAIESLKKKD